MEPLRVIDSENVVFDFNIDDDSEEESNITKAVIIRPDTTSDYLHVVMPLNH